MHGAEDARWTIPALSALLRLAQRGVLPAGLTVASSGDLRVASGLGMVGALVEGEVVSFPFHGSLTWFFDDQQTASFRNGAMESASWVLMP